MLVNGVLFDVQSIQTYIFSNNKLKANVGASYIVDTLFENLLCKDILKELDMPKDSIDIESWKLLQEFGDVLPAPIYVASIGGGSALVLVEEGQKHQIEDIIKGFTTKVMITYPGLKVNVATGGIETTNFKTDLAALYKKLKQNQYMLNPVSRVANTGFTAICDYSGDVAEVQYRYDKNDTRLVSMSFIAKCNMFEAANERLHKLLFGEDTEWRFPSKLDELGQNRSTEHSKKGINDIAIVHIDGNNMGELFRQCNNLSARSRLSKQVYDKTVKSFAELIYWMIARYDVISKNLELLPKMLPIRPLIVGGDDITFICNARIAIQATQYLMQSLLKSEGTDDISISSCAGITVTPTSYPFFRGYEMTEQLCSRAKSIMRAYNEQNHIKESCWLDFLFLHGETAPTLEQLLDNEYSSITGNMHFGPYRVYGESGYHGTEDMHDLQNLISCTVSFIEKTSERSMARNKIKELRSVLQDNEHMMKLFIEQLNTINQELPVVPGWHKFRESLWAKVNGAMKTPYVDAIELMDYVLPEVK